MMNPRLEGIQIAVAILPPFPIVALLRDFVYSPVF